MQERGDAGRFHDQECQGEGGGGGRVIQRGANPISHKPYLLAPFGLSLVEHLKYLCLGRNGEEQLSCSGQRTSLDFCFAGDTGRKGNK